MMGLVIVPTLVNILGRFSQQTLQGTVRYTQILAQRKTSTLWVFTLPLIQ